MPQRVSPGITVTSIIERSRSSVHFIALAIDSTTLEEMIAIAKAIVMSVINPTNPDELSLLASPFRPLLCIPPIRQGVAVRDVRGKRLILLISPLLPCCRLQTYVPYVISYYHEQMFPSRIFLHYLTCDVD